MIEKKRLLDIINQQRDFEIVVFFVVNIHAYALSHRLDEWDYASMRG